QCPLQLMAGVNSVVELQQLLGEGFQTGKTVLFSTMHNSIGCHLFHCIAKLTFGGPAGTSNALQYAHGVGRDFVCKDLANQFLSSVGFNRWIGNCPTQSAVVVNYLQSSKQFCAEFYSAGRKGCLQLGVQLCQ